MSDDFTWPENPPNEPPTTGSSLPAPPPVPLGYDLLAEGVDAPDYVEQHEVIRSGGGVARIVALAIGLLFLGGIGYVAVTSLSGDNGGADSPEDAVQGLVDALANEDIVAALEVMAPSEVGTASQLYPRLVELAVSEGAIEREDWLAGVDFEVIGLQMSTTELHPGVALVELVEGELSVTIDPDVADPIFLDGGDLQQSVTVRQMRGEMQRGLDEAGDSADDFFDLPFTLRAPQGVFLMTVERDGGWYVSPFYSLAEYGRQILDLPPADFTASRENALPGADSPADVVDGLVEMVNSRSLEEHLDAALSGDRDEFEALNVFVPPDEAGVFLDYAASYTALIEDFLDAGDITMEEIQAEAEAMIAEIALEGDVRLFVESREESRDDGAVVIYLESGSLVLNASAVNPDTRQVTTFSVDASWNGLCGRATAIIDNRPEPPISDCVPTDVLPDGFDEVFVVVGEVDGDWYISYVETGLAYAEIFLEDQLDG